MLSVSSFGNDSVGADISATIVTAIDWTTGTTREVACLPVLPAEVLNLFIVLVAAELGAAAAAQNANKIELYRNESDVRYKV